MNDKKWIYEYLYLYPQRPSNYHHFISWLWYLRMKYFFIFQTNSIWYYNFNIQGVTFPLALHLILIRRIAVLLQKMYILEGNVVVHKCKCIWRLSSTTNVFKYMKAICLANGYFTFVASATLWHLTPCSEFCTRKTYSRITYHVQS